MALGDGEFVAHSALDHARDLTASWLAPVTDMDTDTRGVSDPADGRGAGYARRGRGRSRPFLTATRALGRSLGGTKRRPTAAMAVPRNIMLRLQLDAGIDRRSCLRR